MTLRNRECIFKRVEETASGRVSSEKIARIICNLRREYRLKDILAVTGFPKSTYMYWQNRFDKENPDAVLESKILQIRDENKDYGYRRIHKEHELCYLIKK